MKLVKLCYTFKMNEKIEILCGQIFGTKRFEIFKFLCENADENGFIFTSIDELKNKLKLSKPTVINAFKFLEEKKLLKKLKNGFYELKIKDKNEN